MDNKIILSYNESLLRTSDIDLLRGPYWLNDTIISFYFEYLQNEIFNDHDELLFVSPEVTQCIKVSPLSEIGIFLEPLLATREKSFIFFAVNDNDSTDSGGSHWSLLVYSKPERMIFHYDSSSVANEYQAVELGEKILKYFNLPIQGKFQNVPCLQQSNGYDCGIHVLCNAEHLASYAYHYRRILGCPKIKPERVAVMRQEIINIIERLKENKT